MTMRPKAPAATSTDAVFKDIEATIGFVPQFFRQVADTQLASFWSSMKDFEMNPNTALDRKTKELIGLAVAAQIPCDYCVTAHTASLRGLGASDQEIREAVGMAAITRLGSTVLNGSQIDKVQFKKDLQRMSKDSGPVKRQATR
jgi:AhpD family alkylhydroperoxidase